MALLKVDLRPFELDHIGLTQTSLQSEQHHVPLVYRQLTQKGLHLFRCNETNAAFGFLKELRTYP